MSCSSVYSVVAVLEHRDRDGLQVRRQQRRARGVAAGGKHEPRGREGGQQGRARHAGRAGVLQAAEELGCCLVVLRVDPEELHAVAELVALQVQQLRRATLVPLGSIRRPQDQGALEFLDQRLEREAGRRDRAGQGLVHALAQRHVRRCRRGPRRQLEVVRLEHLAVLEQDRALEQVLQLADVARPGVLEQQPLGRRGRCRGTAS